MSDLPPGFEEEEALPPGFEHEHPPVVQAAAPAGNVPSGPTSGLHGAVERLPFGQALVGAGSAGVLALIKALSSNPAYQNLDTSVSGNIAREKEQFEAGKKEHPYWTMGGQGVGTGLSLYGAGKVIQAAPGADSLARGLTAATQLGLYGGVKKLEQGGTPAEILDEAGHQAKLGALGSGTGDLVAAGAQEALPYVEKAAGWLKVNSLHPNPKVAEAMEALPQGKAGVGQALLKRSLGGLTKSQTAEQVGGALGEAGKGIGEAAQALDAVGGEAPNLAAVVQDARQSIAAPLKDSPLSEGVGQKLDDVLGKYAAKFEGAKPSFQDALAFRRELADAIYKNDRFGADPALSDFADGLRRVYGKVNQAIEETAAKSSPDLAKRFTEANLDYRRLGLAKEAAERTAARASSNHMFSLRDVAAATAGGVVHGGAGAAGMALATNLASKYGTQAAARLLYTPVAGALRVAAENPVAQMIAGRSAAKAIDPFTEALIEALRKPAMAGGGIP